MLVLVIDAANVNVNANEMVMGLGHECDGLSSIAVNVGLLSC